jgi:hypothetical protein
VNWVTAGLTENNALPNRDWKERHSSLRNGATILRRQRFTAHGICQSTVLLLNAVLIATIMLRSFRMQVVPQLPHGLADPCYLLPVVHAVLGTAAEALGLYIILVAATSAVPEPLRIGNWKF